MAQKLTSQRSYVEVQDLGSPGVFVRVGNLTGIRDLRSGTATEIDVSDLSSTGKEYILGLNDPGSFSLDVIYDPSDPGHIILETLRETSAINPFRVGVPNPLQAGSPTGFTQFSLNGFVQTFPFSAAVDAALTGSVTVRVSGSITKI